MTIFRHGKLTEVMLADFVASPYLNSADTTRAIEVSDTSAFGTQDKTYIVGQNDGTMSLSGLFDGSPNAIDEFFNDLVAVEGNYPASIFYDGGIKVGRAVRSAQVKQTSYDISSPLADVVSLSAELQCDGGIRQGFALTDNVAVSANTIYAGADWGAGGATTRGGLAFVHLPHNTRSATSSIKIQHSVDNAVWVDLATQPVASATTGHFVVPVAGTVNRYVRVNLTLTAGTGTINVVVAFARN